MLITQKYCSESLHNLQICNFDVKKPWYNIHEKHESELEHENVVILQTIALSHALRKAINSYIVGSFANFSCILVPFWTFWITDDLKKKNDIFRLYFTAYFKTTSSLITSNNRIYDLAKYIMNYSFIILPQYFYCMEHLLHKKLGIKKDFFRGMSRLYRYWPYISLH